MPILDTLRLVGAGGSNRAMEAELKRLGRRGVPAWTEPKPRRVGDHILVYPFSEDLAWLATSYLRTPSRVLMDLYASSAPRLEPLYDELCALVAADERPWLQDGLRITVRAREVADFPAGIRQIQGTVKNAIIDGAADRAKRVRLDPDRADVELSVRGSDEGLVVSVDLAGRSLHERGWRLDRVDAPLRENLAAQILMLARWDVRSEVLLDPMCGSGTFAVEAAAMARADPLWVGRTPTIDRLPPWRDRDHARPSLFADAQPIIVANELHTPAVEAARKNAARAGVEDRVLFRHGDFRDLDLERLSREGARRAPPGWPPSPRFERGLVVCNPPYGERIGRELEALYEDLGDWLRHLGPGWRAALIVADRDVDARLGLTARVVKPMSNASIPASLRLYDLGARR